MLFFHRDLVRRRRRCLWLVVVVVGTNFGSSSSMAEKQQQVVKIFALTRSLAHFAGWLVCVRVVEYKPDDPKGEEEDDEKKRRHIFACGAYLCVYTKERAYKNFAMTCLQSERLSSY